MSPAVPLSPTHPARFAPSKQKNAILVQIKDTHSTELSFTRVSSYPLKATIIYRKTPIRQPLSFLKTLLPSKNPNDS